MCVLNPPPQKTNIIFILPESGLFCALFFPMEFFTAPMLSAVGGGFQFGDFLFWIFSRTYLEGVSFEGQGVLGCAPRGTQSQAPQGTPTPPGVV